MRRLVVAAFVLAPLAVAGCSRSVPGPIGATPSGSATPGYQLIQAQSPACQQQGEQVARYLDTGQPTSLDPTYGNERQNVLAESGEQRALAIRQYADKLIQQCDAASSATPANKILSSEPYEAVRQVYQQIAQGRPDLACGYFDIPVQQTFATDLGYPDCQRAVLDLKTKVTSPTDYAESLPSNVSEQYGDTVVVNSCRFTISGGPALGVFTLTKVDKGQWLITGHQPGPRTCAR